MPTRRAAPVLSDRELDVWVDTSRRVILETLRAHLSAFETAGAGDCEHAGQMRDAITRLSRLLGERPARPARAERGGHQPALRLVK